MSHTYTSPSRLSVLAGLLLILTGTIARASEQAAALERRWTAAEAEFRSGIGSFLERLNAEAAARRAEADPGAARRLELEIKAWHDARVLPRWVSEESRRQLADTFSRLENEYRKVHRAYAEQGLAEDAKRLAARWRDRINSRLKVLGAPLTYQAAGAEILSMPLTFRGQWRYATDEAAAARRLRAAARPTAGADDGLDRLLVQCVRFRRALQLAAEASDERLDQGTVNEILQELERALLDDRPPREPGWLSAREFSQFLQDFMKQGSANLQRTMLRIKAGEFGEQLGGILACAWLAELRRSAGPTAEKAPVRIEIVSHEHVMRLAIENQSGQKLHNCAVVVTVGHAERGTFRGAYFLREFAAGEILWSDEFALGAPALSARAFSVGCEVVAEQLQHAVAGQGIAGDLETRRRQYIREVLENQVAHAAPSADFHVALRITRVGREDPAQAARLEALRQQLDQATPPQLRSQGLITAAHRPRRPLVLPVEIELRSGTGKQQRKAVWPGNVTDSQNSPWHFQLVLDNPRPSDPFTRGFQGAADPADNPFVLDPEKQKRFRQPPFNPDVRSGGFGTPGGTLPGAFENAGRSKKRRAPKPAPALPDPRGGLLLGGGDPLGKTQLLFTWDGRQFATSSWNLPLQLSDQTPSK